MATVLQDNPGAGYVFSDADVVDDSLLSLGYSLWQSLKYDDSFFNRFIDPKKQAEILINKFVVTGATMAFKQSMKKYISPISPYWIHDAWIATVLAAMGFPGIPIREKLIAYRQHGSQQIGAPDLQRKQTTQDKISPQVEIDSFKKKIKRYEDLKKRLELINAVAPRKYAILCNLSDRKITEVEIILDSLYFNGIKQIMAQLPKNMKMTVQTLRHYMLSGIC